MDTTTDKIRQSLKKRHRAERRFRRIGIAAVSLGLFFLVFLFTDIISKGYTAFAKTEIQLTVTLDPEVIAGDPKADAKELYYGNYAKVINQSLQEAFPEVEGRNPERDLRSIVSRGAEMELRDLLINRYESSEGDDGTDMNRNIRIATGETKDGIVESNDPDYAIDTDYIGKTFKVWVTADDEFDMLNKGFFDPDAAEEDRIVNDNVVSYYDKLVAEDKVRKVFNWSFFANSDSTDAEIAGIWGALKGSFYVLMVTLLLSFPIGVSAAIYLEEFAPKNKWTDLIEVNINNLAAVPSIVFGLLGLAVFINFFGLPRSAPIVAGFVLTLMTLPTIIISSRAALRSVPPSIRDAAYGVGASKMQTITHHVLPLSLPGMLTGTIIGMAQALGETAPLLMIGMIAFVMAEPTGIFSNATVLPVQIYLWSDLPPQGFVTKTSAAIMVLLAFLISMNALAVFMRKKFERKW